MSGTHSPGQHEGDAELWPEGGQSLVDLSGEVRQLGVTVVKPSSGYDLPEDVQDGHIEEVLNLQPVTILASRHFVH